MTHTSSPAPQPVDPLPRNEILIGDALTELRKLPSASVDMVFTSPPYFGLRDYDAGQREIGREPHVDSWVENLVAVFMEAARVLAPTGTMWINVGDTYSPSLRHGAPRKSLLLGPSRLALRLVDEGLLLRNDIVWHKRNHLPHPVRDRLTPAWEHLFLFAKQPRYHFDLDAIRVPHTSKPSRRTVGAGTHPRGRLDIRRPGDPRTRLLGSNGLKAMNASGRVGHPLGKNPGDVWQIASSNYRGAHRATMPVELARRAITAACPKLRADATPGVVLDPFIGSGTTAVAAAELGRDYVGVELNTESAQEAMMRVKLTDHGIRIVAQRRARRSGVGRSQRDTC